MSVLLDSTNTYIVTNSYGNDITYEVSKLEDDGTWSVIHTSNAILNGDTDSYTVADDGVYSFEIRDGISSWATVEVVYNNMRECLTKLLLKIACRDCSDCSKCKEKNKDDLYYFNAISLSFFTFLSILNGLYVSNFILDSLSPNQLNDMVKLSTIIQRTKDYCNCAHLTAEDNGEGDCGC